MAKVVDWRGIRGLVAAEVLTDTDEGMTFGDVFPLCGVAALTKTTTSTSTPKYYDNVPAIVIQSASTDEVGIEGSAIQEEEQSKIMGEYYDEATGMYVEGDPVTKYYAIGYITEDTAGEERFVWRLKGTFSYPEETHNTKNDSTDSTGSTLTYTGVNTQCKFKKTGATAKAIIVKASKYTKGEAEFFKTVQTPDTVGAA